MPKQKVDCSICGKELKRWLINPVTKNPIKNFFCDNTCKGIWQNQQRENLGFTKEWLINEYINNKKSANKIAKEIGRDPKRVWEWIRDYGIETRPRGHDTSHLLKDGSSFRGKKHTEEYKKNLSKISKEDGRVPWGKNNKHPLKGIKSELHPNYKGGLTPERQAFYSSIEWVRSVKEVWKRDKAICQKCGKHHNEDKIRGTFHIHHIISFQIREFRADISNLVLLCKECHRWVHSNQNINKDFIKEI